MHKLYSFIDDTNVQLGATTKDITIVGKLQITLKY